MFWDEIHSPSKRLERKLEFWKKTKTCTTFGEGINELYENSRDFASNANLMALKTCFHPPQLITVATILIVLRLINKWTEYSNIIEGDFCDYFL